MLRVGISDGRGRGVFATRDIRAGEVLEDAPVIVLTAGEREAIKRTSLYNYFFRWNTSEGEGGALCLGLGSIYNHSHTPNARYIRLFALNTIRFIALRDIRQGDEVFTNYNGNPDDTSPIWFEEGAADVVSLSRSRERRAQSKADRPG